MFGVQVRGESTQEREKFSFNNNDKKKDQLKMYWFGNKPILKNEKVNKKIKD